MATTLTSQTSEEHIPHLAGLCEQFDNAYFSTFDFRDEYLRKMGFDHNAEQLHALEKSGQWPLSVHPSTLDADMKHYRELFSKLKFNFLEQETKEKFLKGILQEPPLVIEPAHNKDLEARNKEQKKILKATKEETERLKVQIAHTTSTVHEVHSQLTKDVVTSRQILREIQDMESQLERYESQDQRSKWTPNEAQDILLEQTQSLQQINQTISQHQTNIADVQWKINDLRTEIARLETEQKSAESFAQEAIRMSQSKDTQIEELYEWYTGARARFAKWMGMDGETIEVETANPAGEEIWRVVHNLPSGKIALRIIVNPNTGRLVDAIVTNRSHDISSIVERAKQMERQSIAFLVHEVLNTQ